MPPPRALMAADAAGVLAGCEPVASTLGVPVAAYVVLMSAGPAVTIIESTKKLFFGD